MSENQRITSQQEAENMIETELGYQPLKAMSQKQIENILHYHSGPRNHVYRAIFEIALGWHGEEGANIQEIADKARTKS